MAVFRVAAAVLTAAACSTALVSAPALAQGRSAPASAVTVVASGLDDPYELSGTAGRLYVSETATGQVTAIRPRTGATQVVLSGLGVNELAGAVRIGKDFAVLTGGADETGTPAGAVPSSSVLVGRAGQTPRQLADLLKYELRKNPDGQSPSARDALSNPFSILRARGPHGYVLVADGGANDVLAVNRYGRVSTFFVPPTVNTGACAGLPNNDPAHPGCDSVPTGLAYGPHNRLYVSALTAEVPGEGRVYVLDATTGKLLRTIKGFSGPTGVAVDRSGSVYVSELLEGLASAPQPELSTIGQIVKVTRDGHRSYAQVTMPIGVLFVGGKLYSTAWSVAGLFAGLQHAGQVVQVSQAAFTPAS